MLRSGTRDEPMKASAIEFRLRMAINMAIVCLGFWAPWIEAWGIGRRVPLMVWLALELSRMGVVSFSIATPAVIAAGALLAGVGAALRVWGAAALERRVETFIKNYNFEVL